MSFKNIRYDIVTVVRCVVSLFITEDRFIANLLDHPIYMYVYVRARSYYIRDYANITSSPSFSQRFFPSSFAFASLSSRSWPASDFIAVAVHETNISHALSGRRRTKGSQKSTIGVSWILEEAFATKILSIMISFKQNNKLFKCFMMSWKR